MVRPRSPLRPSFVAALLVSFALASLTGGCSKDDDPPNTIPMTTDPLRDPTPRPDLNAASSAVSAATTTTTATAPTPMATTPRPAGASLAGCCAALSARAKKTKSVQHQQAAAMCGSMAPLVSSGQTTRARAVIQLRAVAGTLPPGC